GGASAGHGSGRRHRRRPAGRGGDGEALLSRVRPRATSARKRCDGADPKQGGQGARTRRGPYAKPLKGYLTRNGSRRAASPRAYRAPQQGTSRLCAKTLPWEVQVRQPRRREPSRKVRTSEGEVVERFDPGKPAG